MTKQRFKDSFYEAHSKAGYIFFTGARLALGVQEFREYLVREQGLDREEVEKVLTGCSKCWRDLGKRLGLERVRQINAKIHELDKAGKLYIENTGQVYTREILTKKAALEFLENIKESEVSTFFIGYRK